MTGYYQKHVFICTNQKDEGKKCCAQGDALAAWQHMRERCKELGLLAHNQVRVSKSGCLGRCEEGPCVVIYPEGQWYQYHNLQDIDAIVEQDLANGEPVTQLQLSTGNIS